jgi:hypothetical protein
MREEKKKDNLSNRADRSHDLPRLTVVNRKNYH